MSVSDKDRDAALSLTEIDHRAAALRAALSPLAEAVECEPMPAATVQPAWFAGAPKVDRTRPGYVKRLLRGLFG